MSIKKFEQFINEGFRFNEERLSSNDVINDAYTKLIKISKNTFENNIKKLTLQFPYIDKAIDLIMETYGDIFVSDPDVRVERDMDQIVIFFETDIPSIKYEKYNDEIDKFNKKLKNICEDFSIEASEEGIDIYENNFEIYCSFLNARGRYIDDTLTLQIEIKGLFSDYLINFCKENNVIDEL